MPTDLTVQQEGLQALTRALKQEADGKLLRRDLSKRLREALDPIKDDARSNLMGISSAGLSTGTPLRTTVAQQMKAQARLSGKSAGAALRVRRRGMPRGFANAPKALNNPQGWRHPVMGNRDVWVEQVAQPTEWFDRATRDGHDLARDKAIEAMEDTAARIVKNVK